MANPPMHKPGKRGLARLIATTGYAAKGYSAVWRNEEAFRLEIYLALLFVPLSFWLGADLSERLLLLNSCALVLLAELVNSAIEAAVDRIGAEQHPLSGQAKDIGSALVFTSILFFLISWGACLWQRLV